MAWQRVAALTGLTAMLLVAPPQAEGQVRVRLTGQIDNTAGLERLRVGHQTFETTTWGSRYTPNLDGFVWSPRFLNFSLGGTYANQDTSLPGGDLTFVQRDPYRLQFTLFPQATHSVTLGTSRTVTDNTFSGTVGDIMSRVTTDRQDFAWTFRGSPLLPETVLDLKRQTTENETPTALSEDTRTTITLRARKGFDRSQPALTYTVEVLDHSSSATLGPLDRGGVSHQLQYDDRVRLGDRAFLAPTAQFRIAPGLKTGNAGLTLAGPLSASLDGSTGLRYAVQDSGNVTTQTVATDGVLTKRFSSTATLTSGVTGSVVEGKGMAWGAGAFSGLAVQPLSHLRNAVDYGLQLTGGGDRPASVSQRAHLGAASTVVPRHTVTGDYYLNVFDTRGQQPSFMSHNASTGITSEVIPFTTLTGRYTVDLQESTGEQRTQRVSLGAFFTPFPALTLRAGGDFDTKATSGGNRAPTKETGLAAEAGIDAPLLNWLTFSLSGRRAIRDVEREDKVGKFVSETARGTVSVSFSTFQMRTEGFVEHEPIIDQSRQGIRGAVSYRFRVWTLAVDFERTMFNVAKVDTERERFLFRITRPLNFSWPPR